jgi:hypothetical protein
MRSVNRHTHNVMGGRRSWKRTERKIDYYFTRKCSVGIQYRKNSIACLLSPLVVELFHAHVMMMCSVVAMRERNERSRRKVDKPEDSRADTERKMKRLTI